MLLSVDTPAEMLKALSRWSRTAIKAALDEALASRLQDKQKQIGKGAGASRPPEVQRGQPGMRLLRVLVTEPLGKYYAIASRQKCWAVAQWHHFLTHRHWSLSAYKCRTCTVSTQSLNASAHCQTCPRVPSLKHAHT